MFHRFHRTATGDRPKRLKAAAVVLLLAAVAGGGFALHGSPPARNVWADVYGQDSRSVSSDVYTPGSAKDSSAWRTWYGD